MKQLFTTLLFLFTLGQISFEQNKLKNENIVWADFEWSDPDSKDVMLVTSRLDTLTISFAGNSTQAALTLILRVGLLKSSQISFLI